jgi:hypothetical protein
MKDYRAVPTEVLRDFALSYSETTSIRRVAEEVGVGNSTAHKFITGRTNPQPRVRRLFALWYLERIAGAHIIDVARPYASAVATLVSDIPDEGRIVAVPIIFHGLRAGYASGGLDMPPWLPYLHEANGIPVSEGGIIPVGMGTPAIPARAIETHQEGF